MEKSIQLIEIDGLGHVGGNDGVILTHFGDAIHLDRKQHGDAVSSQATR